MKTVLVVHYLISSLILTAIMLLIYVSVQQSYRTGANDPQMQLAQEVATRLHQKRTIDHLLPADSVDLAQSLSPFIVLYNARRLPVQSTGYLHGSVPVVPSGVLDRAHQNGEDRVTWEPRSGVRLATVVKYVAGSETPYIVVGRS